MQSGTPPLLFPAAELRPPPAPVRADSHSPRLPPSPHKASISQQQQQQHVPHRRTDSSQPQPQPQPRPQPLVDTQQQQSRNGRPSDPRVTTPHLARPTRSQASTPTSAPANVFASPPPLFEPFEEYHSGYTGEENPGHPRPATPLSTRRQQSISSLLPLALTNGSPSLKRTSSRLWDLTQMPLTGDAPGPSSKGDSPRGLGAGLSNWLGMSASVIADGSPPRRRVATPSDMHSCTTPQRARDPSATSSKPATPRSTTSTKTVTATASRFMSALSSRFNAPASPGLSGAGAGADAAEEDEFCTLDIEAALFPPTSPAANRDPFSPAAFRNLEQGAVGLLTHMQAAYRRRVAAARDLEAGRAAQRDELAEADTRCRHLKMQLEGMAHKAQEQERAMRQLMDALHAERAARAEAEENLVAACRSMSVASAASAASAARTGGGGGGGITATPRAESPASEDLGVDEDRQRWRKSAASSAAKSDAGTSFDTDEESVGAESVFSRPRSPTLPGGHPTPDAMSPVLSSSASSSSSIMPPRPKRPVPLSMGSPLLLSPAPMPPRLHPAATTTTTSSSSSSSSTTKLPTGTGHQMSAFQKIIKGIAGGEAGDGCRNCMGQDASVAWDTVGVLRDENRHLKRRVVDLEETVDGVLDMVNGVGM